MYFSNTKKKKSKRKSPAAELHDIAVRIHSFLDRRGQCLIWRGPVRHGRPFFKLRKERIDPRRVMREFTVGSLKRKIKLRTECGDALCCSQVHIVTAKEGTRGRLMDQIEIRDGHWIWQGGTFAAGYGRAFYDGHVDLAHRVFYRMFVGPISEGFYVRQTCGERLCVAPEHLKATEPIGPFGLKYRVPTAAEVKAIRQAFKTSNQTIAKIAEDFGISTYHVARIGAETYRIGREA